MRKILFTGVGALICATLILVLSSCCCKKVIAETTTVMQDSVRTEVQTVTVYVTDTVHVEIPEQKAEHTTADSVSHLETDYAKSDARINPDGTLFHSLENMPQSKPVEFQKPIEKKDSIVYRYKYRDKEVVKEKELSKWQQAKIDYGGKAIVILLLIFAFGVYRIVRKFSIR